MTQNSTPSTANKTVNNALSMTFLFIGLCGTLFTFCQPVEKENQYESVKVSHREYSDTDYQAIYSDPEEEVIPAEHLDVRGTRESGEPIIFELPSFNKAGKYVLDLGNGDFINVQSPKLFYTYKEPGLYRVRLVVHYNGNSEVLHSERIRIEEFVKIAVSR